MEPENSLLFPELLSTVPHYGTTEFSLHAPLVPFQLYPPPATRRCYKSSFFVDVHHFEFASLLTQPIDPVVCHLTVVSVFTS